MSTTLIIYSTTDGHTIKISQAIQNILKEKGNEVSLVPVEDVNADVLKAHDKVIIGASIRYGKHNKQVTNLIAENKALLESKPSAFFTVNLVARKPEKCQPDTNPYIIKFLAELDWQPSLQGVFAGKLNYAKYGFLDRNMIRFIMWMTKGPTDPSSNIEFTNWETVNQFSLAFDAL